MTTTTNIQVTGMTCEHCVRAVTEELGTVAGVTAVDVALVPDGESAVTITSEVELARTDLLAAIEEAGYEVTPT